MQEYIDKIGYGNKDISGGFTHLLLGSSLQISALEQVDLLNKLYSGQLPFSAANTAILKEHHSFRGRRHQADGQNRLRAP